MVLTLKSAAPLKRGDYVSFLYNGKVRSGTIDVKGKNYLTLRHKKPSFYGGKRYSTYSFNRIESLVNLHLSRRQAGQSFFGLRVGG